MLPADHGGAQQLHVLVVDDSATVRMDLRAGLHEIGFTVTACTSKLSAEKILKTRAFNLYILDVTLSDGTGIDLLKQIRETPGIAAAPVLLLSSEAEVRHRVRGLRVGANDYIGKPYNRHYLIRRAHELVHAASGEGGIHAASPAGRKILVIDDNLAYAKRLRSALQEDGYEFVIASSGEEALELLSVDRVDAIVMNLHMPGMSGLETCQRIRAERAGALVPMLMLASSADCETRREECLAAGADDVAIKSSELRLMKLRLRGLLQAGRRGTESGGASAGGAASGAGRPSGVESERSRASERRELWTQPSPPPSPSSPPPSPSLPPPSPSSPPPSSPIEAAPGTLLARVVAATGIAPAIGTSAVARACARAGVSAARMSGADLRRALPTLRQTLILFVPPEEVEDRMNALSLLASLASGTGRPV
jgi:DNA-binding response OmpR family regulator